MSQHGSPAAGPRVFLGGLAHETHSFAVTPTPEADFRAYEWAEGDEILATYRGTGTSLGGAIAGAEAAGLTVVPGFYAFAVPSGLVPAPDYDALEDRLIASLASAQAGGALDGVILVCHGAMVAAGTDDVESDLAERVRAAIGPETPLVVTLDFHANIGARLTRAADLVVGYDTYPHVDVAERGAEAAVLLRRLIDGVRPAVAHAAVPILAVPGRQGTDDLPMRALLARAHAIEADPRVLVVTLAGGFCYSDVPEAGMAVVVGTDGDPALAAAYAAELQALVWAQRDAFVQTDLPPAEAVARALAAPPGRPAILVDGADNVGGGAPGDGTILLAELLRQGATDCAVVLADSEAVAWAFAAGVGGAFSGPVGGKTDGFHGNPVDLSGTVRLLSDGRFTYRGSYMTGQARTMGRTAVLDVAGNHVVLTEHKTMPFDAEHLRSVGISPEWCRAIVVKSATGWRAAFGDLAGLVLETATPGICTSDLASLPFRNVRRPIFPLDPAAGIALQGVRAFGRGAGGAP